MTYEEATALCAAHQLSTQEQATYDAMLHQLAQATAAGSLNLFPLLRHWVSDAMASQIDQAPVHTREGLLVTLSEQVGTILHRLTTATCVMSGSLREEAP